MYLMIELIEFKIVEILFLFSFFNNYCGKFNLIVLNLISCIQSDTDLNILPKCSFKFTARQHIYHWFKSVVEIPPWQRSKTAHTWFSISSSKNSHEFLNFLGFPTDQFKYMYDLTAANDLILLRISLNKSAIQAFQAK